MRHSDNCANWKMRPNKARLVRVHVSTSVLDRRPRGGIECVSAVPCFVPCCSMPTFEGPHPRNEHRTSVHSVRSVIGTTSETLNATHDEMGKWICRGRRTEVERSCYRLSHGSVLTPSSQRRSPLGVQRRLSSRGQRPHVFDMH